MNTEIVQEHIASLEKGLEALGVECKDRLIIEDQDRVTVILTTTIDMAALMELVAVARP